MHVVGKCKISWSNDDLERFYKSGHFEPPRESITSQGAGADRVKYPLKVTRFSHLLFHILLLTLIWKILKIGYFFEIYEIQLEGYLVIKFIM